MVEKRIGKHVKTLKTNNGLEFYNALITCVKGRYILVLYCTIHSTTKWGCRTKVQNTNAT